jgi:hypothetical protein
MQSIADCDVYGPPVDYAFFHLASDWTDDAIPWIARALDRQRPFAMMILPGGQYGHRIRASFGWPAIARRSICRRRERGDCHARRAPHDARG